MKTYIVTLIDKRKVSVDAYGAHEALRKALDTYGISAVCAELS